jgi:uncharacterized protein with HEPN domain
MHPKSPKWLQDIADACGLIRLATRDHALATYEQDAVIRSAVERNFEIIGEALNSHPAALIRPLLLAFPSMMTSSLFAIC